MTATEEISHRGVRWRRDGQGRPSFLDPDGTWVRWGPKIDAPPLPPGWADGQVARAGWVTHWRLVPLILTVAVVIIAVLQGLNSGGSSGDAVAKEATASAALLGKCLAQHGTVGGQPTYSSKPVPCDSPKAALKVVKVLPPGSPLCPAGTTGIELPYRGVTNPHIECAAPVQSG